MLAVTVTLPPTLPPIVDKAFRAFCTWLAAVAVVPLNAMVLVVAPPKMSEKPPLVAVLGLLKTISSIVLAATVSPS